MKTKISVSVYKKERGRGGEADVEVGFSLSWHDLQHRKPE